MARYKRIDMRSKVITVDFTQQILPGSFEYATKEAHPPMPQLCC